MVGNFLPRLSLLMGYTNDFIVHIRKVLNIMYLITALCEEAADSVPRYKGTRISDMRVIVRRNSADIYTDLAIFNRLKNFLLTCKRIINLYCSHIFPHCS